MVDVNKRIRQIVAENKMPEIINLMYKAWPNVNIGLNKNIIEVLNMEDHVDKLEIRIEKTLNSLSRRIYPRYWDLPLYLALAIIKDAKTNLSMLDAPTKQELLTSNVFSEVKVFLGDEEVEKFINNLPN